MPDRPFQVLQDSVPPMIGRSSTMDMLLRGLVKAVPSHLQIAGSRYVGKSVLANALAEAMRASGKPFSAVALWDLGRHYPSDDATFLSGLRDRVAEALAPAHREWADAIRDDDGELLGTFKEVLTLLKEDGITVLVILDGLDKVLSKGTFTRNLWDNLAELGRYPSLRYVTTSTSKLHELIRDPDSAVSDFWGIFDQNPIMLGCFGDEDISLAIGKIAGLTLDAGARTTLLNWTNGFPPLVLSVLNELVVSGVTGAANAQAIVNASELARHAVEPVLKRLWEDCSVGAKEVQRGLNAAEGHISTTGLPGRDVSQLIDRGFAQQHGNRLQRPCLLLQRYLADTGDEGNSLQRLFSTEETFLSNSKTVLEHRLSQLDGLDRNLRRSLQHGIDDLPEHPDNCLTNIRNIVERALELVWAVELENRHIPSDWFDTWNRNGERGHERWNGQFPVNLGHKVRLLNFMTGTERSGPVARYVKRTTYALVAAAQGFGDAGQHPDGAGVHPGAAFAAMAVCVELAAELKRRLPGA